jgi:hypothetical protein
MDEISFNDMPRVISLIYSKLEELEKLILANNSHQLSKENDHVLMNTDEACEFLTMPKPTLYAKLIDGSIPSIKQGKRYYIYKDELIQWLETGRKISCDQRAEELYQEILSTHKRKSKPIKF